MAAKDHRLVWTVIFVVLFSCLLHLIFFYGITRVPTSLSCNAISVFKTFSFAGSINASHLIPGMTAQSVESSSGESFRRDQDQLDFSFAASKKVETSQQSLSRHGYGHYPFVQFSAYRESTRAFYVVGITSSVLREFEQPVHECEWHNLTNTLVTKAEMIYVYYDQFPRIYVVATVNCSFEQDVGMEDLGGSLIITVSVAPKKGHTEKVVAMVEQKGAASEFVMKRDSPPPLEYAFCGPPIHSSIRGDWIVQWLVYHHYLWKGKAHFFFYNVGGLQDHLHHRLLDPWVKAGYVSIINVTEQKQYPSWYHNQLLMANDCLHRTRFLASWTFFYDLDEFLHIPPPTTLSSLLSEHRHAPYITFGSIWANTSICADAPEDSREWPVQRLLWMQKQPFCAEAQYDPWVCRQWQGSRKYAANPRKVFAAAVHTAALPDVGGSDLNATIARMYHYHGGLSTEASMCEVKVNLSLPKVELRKLFPDVYKHNNADFSLSRTIAKARNALPHPLITL